MRVAVGTSELVVKPLTAAVEVEDVAADRHNEHFLTCLELI